MMSTVTASPIPVSHHHDAGPGTALASDQPQYRPVGGGKFEPANAAAREECARWNAWADHVNARTARRSTQL